MDPSLQAHVFETALSGDGEEMVKHRAANAQAADMLSRVHRLQLRMLIIEPLERADRDQLLAAADTEEGDGGVEQAIDLERVCILWRAVQTPERQMMLDELSHVIERWIGDRDVEHIHQDHARLTLGLRFKFNTGPVIVRLRSRSRVRLLDGDIGEPLAILQEGGHNAEFAG
jgi:hypothetical protein